MGYSVCVFRFYPCSIDRMRFVVRFYTLFVVLVVVALEAVHSSIAFVLRCVKPESHVVFVTLVCLTSNWTVRRSCFMNSEILLHIILESSWMRAIIILPQACASESSWSNFPFNDKP